MTSTAWRHAEEALRQTLPQDLDAERKKGEEIRAALQEERAARQEMTASRELLRTQLEEESHALEKELSQKQQLRETMAKDLDATRLWTTAQNWAGEKPRRKRLLERIFGMWILQKMRAERRLRKDLQRERIYIWSTSRSTYIQGVPDEFNYEKKKNPRLRN